MNDCQLVLDGDTLSIMPLFERLDGAHAARFKSTCLGAVAQAEEVVIDMRHIQFVDSSGLGALVSLLKAMDGNASLRLANVGAGVRMLLELTRLDRIFNLDAAKQDAGG